MSTPHATRRQVLIGLIATVGTVAIGGSVLAADALPKLTEDDPTAKALGYVSSAAKAAKDPAYKKESTCAKCALYQAAQEQGGFAPCAAFPGNAVSKGGWCRAFAPKV